MSSPLVTTETKVVIGFMFLGLTLWYAAAQVTDSDLVALATLIGVGVVVPTAVNEWRARRSRGSGGSEGVE